MKQTVYIETTIVSYLTSWPSQHVVRQSHEILTRKWWELRRLDFDLRTSVYTLDEAGAGDPTAAKARLEVLQGVPILNISSEAQQLAVQLLIALALPSRAALDAAHVAISAVHSIDFLLTWNCRHLANGQLTARINTTCQLAGFRAPQILTPEMLIG